LPERGLGTAVAGGHEQRLEQRKTPLLGKDIDSRVYRQLVQILKERYNFHLDGYKAEAIKRRVAARVRTAGMADPQHYVERLQEDPAECRQLLLSFSIHVSQFFRNRSAFVALEQKILPRLLIHARHNRVRLRIWSVGCANGEEAYSLALVCQGLLREADSLAIIGTDVSDEALKRARKGVYPAERLKNVPPELLQTFFNRHGDDYRVQPSLRHFVQFFRHDIQVDQPFSRADLILCRNLLIYFDREQQGKIVEKLAAVLQPEGYLMLGRSETLAPGCRELFRCVDAAERIYQRLRE